jgi:hypothetical protein
VTIRIKITAKQQPAVALSLLNTNAPAATLHEVTAKADVQQPAIQG